METEEITTEGFTFKFINKDNKEAITVKDRDIKVA